jgi:rubrerythrin
MTELEKLKHLLEHWIEHNEAHAKTYGEWALKAESSGTKELSVILKQIAEDSKKLDGLFKKALKSI